MVYDSRFADPSSELACAVGRFCLAWGQLERGVLVVIKRLRGWKLAQMNEWGGTNIQLDKRIAELKHTLARTTVPREHEQTIRSALRWITKNRGERNRMVHGALLHRRHDGRPAFNFRQTAALADVTEILRLAKEARQFAEALDAARWTPQAR